MCHLPMKRRLVAGLLQQLREEACSARNGRIVIDDVMPVRVQAGQNARAAGRAQRRGDERVLEMRAVARQRVEVRRAQPRLRMHEPHRVVAMVVGEDENDIAAGGAVARRRLPVATAAVAACRR